MKTCYAWFVFFVLFNTALKAQEHYVTFGSGGGFSGAATVYKIMPDGKVYKGNGLGEIKFTDCSKMKKSRAKKIIQNISEHIKAVGDFNHPGNMYYFLSLHDNKQDSKITWGDNTPVPDDTKSLYAEVIKTVGALSYKPMK